MLQYAGRFSEAETITLAVQGRAPNSAKVHVQLGRIFAATGRFDRAAEEFLKVADPTTGSAYVDAEVASAYAGAGRIAEAQTILDRLLVRAQIRGRSARALLAGLHEAWTSGRSLCVSGASV